MFILQERIATFTNAWFSYQVCPLIPGGRQDEILCVHSFPYSNQVTLGNHEIFSVDYALPIDCSQSQLFATSVSPLIDCVLEGNNNLCYFYFI